MENIGAVVVGLVLAVVAIGFGNWFGTLLFSLVRLAGATVSIPFSRSDRLVHVGLLSLASGWGGIFNNVFIFALIVAVAGSFLSWGISAGASTVSWAAFAIACLLYFVGGIGEGANRGQKLRVLTASGFSVSQIDLLDASPESLTKEQLVSCSQRRAGSSCQSLQCASSAPRSNSTTCSRNPLVRAVRRLARRRHLSVWRCAGGSIDLARVPSRRLSGVEAAFSKSRH
jgi:hypothetical protein